jgi:amino acid permease
LYNTVSFNVSESAIQPNTKGISFNRFSIQYLGLLMALCLLPLLNLKKIDKVLAAARFGTIALVLYFLMLVIMFILCIAQHNLIPSGVNLWAQDIDGWIEIAGLFSLAFISHNTIAPVVKDN